MAHHLHVVLAIAIDVQQRAVSIFPDRANINVTTFWQFLKALIQADAAFDGKQVRQPMNTTPSPVTVQRFCALQGGSIFAEHSVGSLKLEKHKSPVGLRIMRAIKLALDSDSRMNPGRVLRG